MSCETASGKVSTGSARRTRPDGRRGYRSRHWRDGTRWLVLAVLLVLLAGVLFPFLIALINAFKTADDYTAHGPLGIPRSLDFTAIKDFWSNVNYTRKLLNSVVISGAVAVIAVALSLLSAYAIGVGRIRFRTAMLAFFLLATTIPQEAMAYPIYYLFKAVGLYDTKLSMIIVFGVLYSAFGTLLLSAVLSAFPQEILEAARLDGASRWQILRRVVVPVVWPTLTVLMTFFFIWSWNEFLLPLIFLVSDGNQTVSVALGTLRSQYSSSPTTMAAAALLGIVPALVFFFIFQRTLMRGTTVGAVK
jgi:raffinose/stachyose/melibiose transport system permease protein